LDFENIQEKVVSLYRHQKEAVEFAIRNRGCCALFHDPGLGKTRTGLEVFRYYRGKHPGLRLLVVCPLSLVNSAWGVDIKKFTDFTYASFKEITGEVPDIVVINYECLISKNNLPLVESLIWKHRFMCILDESSRLKNNKSVTTKTLLALAECFPYRLIASGTPMPNSELELWGQMNFVQPELLHKSFYAFRNTYFHLERNGIMRQGSRYMSKDEIREIFSQGWKYAITDENRELLMSEIKPCTHWVKKEEALDLPEKIDEIREVTLSAQERKAYKEMEDLLITEIEGVEVTAQIALTKLMKLRQVTAGFLYSATGSALQIGTSSKIKELDEVLEELGNQPVIIWVQFHHEVHAIQKLISDKYGANQVTTLYSDTPDRDESINKFKNNEVRYLIAHPRSAAHGLTFVNCSAMVFFSLDYSYEAHAQARDRIHRIGQNKSCLYVYLAAKDSIDEELLKVLQRKQSLQDVVYGIVRKKAKGKSTRNA
jgi:SNF2 family DNA or RNA helicase